MYTENEMKTLNEMANEICGCDFEDLDYEDQDMIYCMMEEM